MRASLFPVFTVLIVLPSIALAGPFEQDGVKADDPAILAWATGYMDYLPAGDVGEGWRDPEKALGPATGRVADVVSLGEPLYGSSDPPGEITLTFDSALFDADGTDFAVFENSFFRGDGLFAELAYVEVSTDGEAFAAFPCVSLTAGPVGKYGVIDPTDVYNLAGRHSNSYGTSEGTPFDLSDLADDPLVESGDVDLQEINFIRLVDVPGSGEYFDTASEVGYGSDHPIYDAYPTQDSSGFDLEAIGVLSTIAADDDDDSTGDDDDDDDDSAGDDDSIDDDDGSSSGELGSAGNDSGCGS